jgi:DNA-binding CsgD family transcriptional regulator
VRCACSARRGWLDERRREHLRCAVRRFSPRRSLPAHIIVDGWAVRLCRLDGSAGHFMLASITGLEVPKLSAKAALTPRQREILDYLVEGMTHGEITQALALSPYTVNDLVRAIYERLGVSGRVALVRMLAAADELPLK